VLYIEMLKIEMLFTLRETRAQADKQEAICDSLFHDIINKGRKKRPKVFYPECKYSVKNWQFSVKNRLAASFDREIQEIGKNGIFEL
jgi:hypothetical protein